MPLLPLFFVIEFLFSITYGTTFRRSGQGIRRVSDIVDEIEANVFEIDLSDNEISRIYARDFVKFRRCRKLELRDNKIQTLDVDAFEGLTSLEDLRLYSNELTIFPNLTDVPRLRTL